MIFSKTPFPAAQCLFGELFTADNVIIHFHIEDTRALCYNEQYRRLTDEQSIISVTQTEPIIHIEVRCSGEKSAFYALHEIQRRTENGLLHNGTFVSSPSFAVRGYIEGFYGTPWKHEQRLSVMRLMAKYRMNTYYYAPKDDPYHRDRWREPYPSEKAVQLKELIDTAHMLHVDFYWCIAPGLSVCYSAPEEFESLCTKTEQLYSLGVRHFGLLLDDIGDALRFPEDVRQYAEPVNAHIDLICKYYDYLIQRDPTVKLTVCPTVYHGVGNEYYISKLGKSIPPQVSLFWTGRDICSREITSQEAITFLMNTNHKPLYWDNYPVNDEAMFREMHLGPVIGRDASLAKYAQGLIANCMEYAECSKIPLCTIADFLWYGEQYAPEDSFIHAVNESVGKENTEAFLTFADHLYTSCLQNDNSRRLTAVFFHIAKAIRQADPSAAKAIAEDYLQKTEACLLFLAQDLPLCRELHPWANKFKLAVEIMKRLLLYMESPEKEPLRTEIYGMIERYAADPTVLINEMLFREVLMDRFSDL